MLCVMNVPFLSGEYWYGGASHDGVKMPIGANDCYEIDCTKNETPNQMMPLVLVLQRALPLGAGGLSQPV